MLTLKKTTRYLSKNYQSPSTNSNEYRFEYVAGILSHRVGQQYIGNVISPFPKVGELKTFPCWRNFS
jgi:hypothetical protein